MQNHVWLEELQKQLRWRLPADKLRRIIDELRDHQTDAAEDESRASDFGSSEELANRFLAEYRGRSFIGRHPWMSMVLVPVLSVFLTTFVACISCVLLIVELLPEVGLDLVSEDAPTIGGYCIATGAFYLTGLLCFIAAMNITGFAWRKTGRGFGWMITAVAIQAIAAAMVFCQLDLMTDPRSVTVHFGDEHLSNLSNPTLFQVTSQTTLTLLAAIPIVLRRTRSYQGHVAEGGLDVVA